LPAEGEVTFQIVGDMTLHGVTRPLTWDASAQFEGDSVSGQARTSFTFDEFDMDVPSVSVVLSVENDIRLEIDFAGTISRE
jgi:polyisoprenoid-binding protein YceI